MLSASQKFALGTFKFNRRETAVNVIRTKSLPP